MSEVENIQINGGYPLHTIEDVEDVYFNYVHSETDRKLIRSAYEFVIEKHKGQMRKSGEEYYHHLVEVAYILATLNCGPSTIASGLLHDVVEDTDTTVKDIEKNWGKEVAKIVDSLTKIQRLKLSKITAEEFEAEDHRKIFLGMARDIRVIIIKLADRLHNMRTLSALSPERQIGMSRETLDVFVPIAHRLGLETVKSEMEDLCLKYLEPEKNELITSLLKKKQKTLNKSLESLKKKIADILFENNIEFEISSRVKSNYSIYRKMFIKGHQFDEIYDILALRIITESEINCYEIMGLIHKSYTPVPGRVKDYIAMPKPNMYQSLHTTIVGGDGNFYEIQIRTRDMDSIAESGVAAHWAYKEGSGYNSVAEQREIENKLHWFRDFVSMSSNSDQSATEFMDNLNHDIFEKTIYVFTPKGRVIELPVGSTPIDFAYRIHTRIGDTCVGALVNGSMVPLYTSLKTGDMVEVKTNKNQDGPSEGWLDFVKSNAAKNRIKKFIAKKNEDLLRDDMVTKGKQYLMDAFRERDVEEKDAVEFLNNETLLKKYECENIDDLFLKIFQRKFSSSSVIDFLKIKKSPTFIPTNKKNAKFDQCPVYCNGADNIAITLANCCTPIPGDEIIGYITKGKGITVHRADCPNIINEKERVIDVFWKDRIPDANYPVDIVLEASDRNNLLVDVMHTLTNNHIDIHSISAKSNRLSLTATIDATILVRDRKKLETIFAILHGIPGVFDVKRVIH